mmetsp:Transcript_21147/g.58718  ORF Transcript_21147/g.58718 Transcript_21147/m.58718 type:complete len:222 (-) Transcript_21147:3196-3861(-)
MRMLSMSIQHLDMDLLNVQSLGRTLTGQRDAAVGGFEALTLNQMLDELSRGHKGQGVVEVHVLKESRYLCSRAHIHGCRHVQPQARALNHTHGRPARARAACGTQCVRGPGRGWLRLLLLLLLLRVLLSGAVGCQDGICWVLRWGGSAASGHFRGRRACGRPCADGIRQRAAVHGLPALPPGSGQAEVVHGQLRGRRRFHLFVQHELPRVAGHLISDIFSQ